LVDTNWIWKKLTGIRDYEMGEEEKEALKKAFTLLSFKDTKK
jgi:hypothetical protein